MNPGQKIRVLVVDDSAVVRKMITEALSQDPEIEVVGTAPDPYVARDKILELHPDVLTLDVDMPRMDGITFLRILQKHHPMPVVVVSSLTQAGSHAALAALEAGAVDVLTKPTSAYSIGALAEHLAVRVKGAATAKYRTTPAAAAPPPPPITVRYHPRSLILIGASTGGTEALKSVMARLPNGLPGICVVQHIPAYFSKAFANRLNELCPYDVREAVDGDEARPGVALLAPGDFHMVLQWRADRYVVSLRQGPPINHSRPSVDVLFNSAVECVGRHAVAVVLTGMGRDGAVGMKKLRDLGATTIAQNEESCVVYGMPRAAVELGGAAHVLPLDRIADGILRALEMRRAVTQPQEPRPLR
jgi:two-component system chemotaxis response regulator CheB